MRLPTVAVALAFVVFCQSPAQLKAHDPTRVLLRQRADQLAQNNRLRAQHKSGPSCRLTIRLLDADNGKPIAGVVRISRKANGERIVLGDLIRREQDWYSMTSPAVVQVPQVALSLQALRGIETKQASATLDLRGKATATIDVPIKRFANLRAQGWRNGNTHLHIMKRTFAEADRYLRVVPLSDDLELVYLSHLRRIPDEKTYISNLIVENSLPGGDLARLSQGKVLFRPGEEHRHNYGRGGEGYGHVMLLDIAKLIRPVSIGPGIMAKGYDAPPLQTGIRQARRDGATVIWCHNQFGLEDIPNWMSGDLDAQNIFDGGNRGSYEESYYRYLNIGLKTPFSTGTDWFIDDFSRVYTPLNGELSSEAWLKQLRAGRSFITNGPLLEFSADEKGIGETIKLDAARTLTLRGAARSRTDFGRLELVHNGKVVATAASQADDGHFLAKHEWQVKVDEPGWFALRTPLDDTKNAFGNQLYSHTSPIYVEYKQQKPFDKTVARQLLKEMQTALMNVKRQSKFANDEQRESVFGVYRRGIEALTKRLEANE